MSRQTHQWAIITNDQKIRHGSRDPQDQGQRDDAAKWPTGPSNDNGRTVTTFAKYMHISEAAAHATKESMKVLGSAILLHVLFPACGYSISFRSRNACMVKDEFPRFEMMVNPG